MKVEVFLVSGQGIKNQCYLIHDNHSGILIDPAWDYELISSFLKDNHITLRGVLLTHSHYDHTDLASTFAVYYGVPVYMSAIEIRQYEFTCPNLIAIQHLQDVMVGQFSVTALLTPGHTKGSVCYLIDRHCFTGDTIFIEGVGICDNSGINSLYDSVQFIKQYLPQQTLIWPGHSFGEQPGKELSFLLQNNIYFLLNRRDAFTDFRMRKNQPDPFSFK